MLKACMSCAKIMEGHRPLNLLRTSVLPVYAYGVGSKVGIVPSPCFPGLGSICVDVSLLKTINSLKLKC